MKQYEKGGPAPDEIIHDTKNHHTILHDLERRIDDLEKHIRDQDRVLRKIKNDLRMSVNAINRMNNG